MDLLLRVTDQVAEATAAHTTTVGVPLQYFEAGEDTYRVVAGAPDKSALLLRMQERGPDTAMPPLGTERVDIAAIALVGAWIESL